MCALPTFYYGFQIFMTVFFPVLDVNKDYLVSTGRGSILVVVFSLWVIRQIIADMTLLLMHNVKLFFL